MTSNGYDFFNPDPDEDGAAGPRHSHDSGLDIVGADQSGRHAVPEDHPQERAGSYDVYFDDPPYARPDDEPTHRDAGVPPSPAALARAMNPDWSTSAAPVEAPVFGTALADPPAEPLGIRAGEQVTCPECGAVQSVNVSRRDATDFCTHCDYPLFWTPSRVTRERALDEHSEALRRLPGAVGRSTLASAICPTCSERNLISAQVCVRCGSDMHPVAPPPPVAYVPPPPPEPEPEPVPDTGLAWWIWLLIGTGAVVLVAAIVWIVLANN